MYIRVPKIANKSVLSVAFELFIDVEKVTWLNNYIFFCFSFDYVTSIMIGLGKQMTMYCQSQLAESGKQIHAHLLIHKQQNV